MLKELFGYAAAILALVYYLQIIIAIWSKTIRPSRTTWIIWGVNDFLILCTSFFVGAWNTLWVPLVYVICGLACLVLSIRNDKAKLSLLDKSCLAGSIAAWILWIYSDSAVIALAIGIVVNTIGVLPTLAKTWRDPSSEKVVPWAISTITGILQVLALEKFTFGLLLFPVDTILVSGSVLILAMRAHRRSTGASPQGL